MTDPTVFTADLTTGGRPLRQPWQWCVGSGHATLALRADWQAQLAQAHRDLGFRHVRFHGLLDDDMGTLVDEMDKPVYSFINIDRIYDFLRSVDMRPVVELSFMPSTLSSGGRTVFHYNGNITPPRDLAHWGELIRRLVQHLVDRYGIEEVARWPFEVWNEPNLSNFWTGDQAAWFELYRTTAEAIKSVDARLQVGGPVTAANGWLKGFVGHCQRHGLPFDFVSTHHYPTDAFGEVGADTATKLEHSPRGLMREKAMEAREHAGARPLYYTEWNISSNPRDPLHDNSFAAALATRIVMSVDDVVDGYSWWTFTDIFEENYLPSHPYHGGFGLMNLYGVPKPVYRALQMLRSLGDAQFQVEGAHDTLAAWVGRDTDAPERGTCAVLINQAMPRHPIWREPVRLQLTHDVALRPRAVTLARIDEEHANPERAWKKLGEPEYPSPEQVRTLQAASLPLAERADFTTGRDNACGTTTIELELAPQSVNHLRIDWQAA